MKIGYSVLSVEQLERLPPSVRIRILTKIDFYRAQPNPLAFAKPLTGYNAYRFRIGMYRVIFEIKPSMLYVIMIVKRDRAYLDL